MTMLRITALFVCAIFSWSWLSTDRTSPPVESWIYGSKAIICRTYEVYTDEHRPFTVPSLYAILKLEEAEARTTDGGGMDGESDVLFRRRLWNAYAEAMELNRDKTHTHVFNILSDRHARRVYHDSFTPYVGGFPPALGRFCEWEATKL